MHHPVQFQEIAKAKQADRVRLASAYRVAQQSEKQSSIWISIPRKIGHILANLKDLSRHFWRERVQAQA